MRVFAKAYLSCSCCAVATVLLGISGVQVIAAQEAPSKAEGDEQEAEIIVRGDLPRCHQRAGDPLDQIDTGKDNFVQSVIKPDTEGVWRLTRDDDPIMGPDVWQRAGKGIGDFRFRVPLDEAPLCIGSWGKKADGWGQLRQIVDAVPLRGRYARFSAYVATRRSNEVRFWLAVGNERGVIQGGDTSAQPVRGTRKWMPVLLTIGPIPKSGLKLSYGFLLKGAGDVWVLKPRLEIFDEAPRAGQAARLNKHDRE